MRIAIITFHDTANFGATLQCAALSHFLDDKGHDVVVINYLPRYVRDKKSIFKEFKNINSNSNKVKAFVKGFCYMTHSKEIKKKNKKYDVFIANNITTTNKYLNGDELSANPPKADLFICGSDQIWNPALTGGKLDKAFFLTFASGRKASYGASVGEMNIETYAEEIKGLTSDFLRISVREHSVATALANVLKRDVSTVLDCTLLLNKEDYYPMEVDYDINNRYLLLYNIQNSSVAISIARRIAKERKLEIIDISPNPFVRFEGTKKILDIGPGEFLSLFHRADYVVTNSFHGTVFSIIYEKQFIVIPHSTRSSRVSNLLRAVGLTDRIAVEPGYMEKSQIDYGMVKEKLSKERELSTRFLYSITEEVGNRSRSNDAGKNSNDACSDEQKMTIGDEKPYPDLVKQRAYCCGCEACVNICSRTAIEMKRDYEGFLYPYVDRDRCIKCYLCIEICRFKKDLAY